MFELKEQNAIKRKRILQAFTNMAEGESMSYAQLSSRIGYPLIDSSDPQFRWALRRSPDNGVVIRHQYGTTEFKRLTKQEIASDTVRAKRIKTQARAGFDEVSVAMSSNDKNVQAIASAKAARYSLIRDTAPVSNKKLVSDKL